MAAWLGCDAWLRARLQNPARASQRDRASSSQLASRIAQNPALPTLQRCDDARRARAQLARQRARRRRHQRRGGYQARRSAYAGWLRADAVASTTSAACDCTLPLSWLRSSATSQARWPVHCISSEYQARAPYVHHTHSSIELRVHRTSASELRTSFEQPYLCGLNCVSTSAAAAHP
eukprot:COSAG01_NODE_1772_length_9263_cov_93.070930_7_plen_177_part_00